MPTQPTRYLSVVVALAAVALLASGCLLRASSEEIPATAVAQNLPTLTPTATETAVLPTPEPQVTTEFVVVTATPDETLLAAQATADALSTLSAAANPPGVTEVAQLDPLAPTLDPLILEVTQTVAAATQIFADLTATAEAPLLLPTLTPTSEFIPTATPASSVPISGTDCIHVVRAGENLFRIGLRYGVPFQTIANYNGIANPTIISIGQEISIPNCGQGTTDLGSGAGGSETGGAVGAPVVSGTPIGQGGICGSPYIVDQYETLFSISLSCNVLIRDIMALNPTITNPDLIYFNQQLTMP
ncbi:MAG: LysM peptidoglycan-binding domain-containing protein [Anaerolineae bacterium]|jgi:LysM repeat protein|nr:LysM peptidoglycan-binding domain-containing protein [Anaerolineae bacterium]